jgi:sugar/nucleoside kinase (ribokinase family)
MRVMPHHSFDPLAARRTPDAPDVDVFLWGTVFLDLIFAGIPTAPKPGTEVWAEGMASCPGGIANLAVAARRLGLRTSLAAAFSDDDYGDFCWRTLERQEGIDLSHSRQFPNWHSPVTVSMSMDRDRSMVSHGHPPPVSAGELIGVPPRSRAVMVDLAEEDVWAEATDGRCWVDLARNDGALAFADVGWDPLEKWDPNVLARLSRCDAFMPNAVEAMAYTGTATPQEALFELADRVPIAVVTMGPDGAVGIDAFTGEEAQVPSLRVHEVDPTGAGDVFLAALTAWLVRPSIVGGAGSDPGPALAFAAAAASLVIERPGLLGVPDLPAVAARARRGRPDGLERRDAGDPFA